MRVAVGIIELSRDRVRAIPVDRGPGRSGHVVRGEVVLRLRRPRETQEQAQRHGREQSLSRHRCTPSLGGHCRETRETFPRMDRRDGVVSRSIHRESHGLVLPGLRCQEPGCHPRAQTGRPGGVGTA